MRRRKAFTLTELMIVITIIGILITFIIKASMGGIRRAEEKATIALIAKLEQAMTDRVDALTTFRADPTPAHYTLAAMFNGTNPRIESVQRAQAIAQFDYIRAQLPDAFYVQSTAATVGSYPLNFAGVPYGTNNAVPLGADNSSNGTITGMYGAAFEIAGGIYKQLGYHPKGYNGNDDNFDGFVDDALEGIGNLSAAEQVMVTDRLTKHTHKTARSEMLYAILVEGGGTYGSSFDKDDFTAREVQDTDGDGLMEFVDAWGEPLQFYRWPILYRSDSQKGCPDLAKINQDLGASLKPGPYASAYESREQNPMDPNQTLMAPAWWGSTFNNNSSYTGAASGVSSSAMTFQSIFGPLLYDPLALYAGTFSNATFWDRSTSIANGYYFRRAYYSRFLIVSGGPDKLPGIAQCDVNYASVDDRSQYDVPNGTPVGARDTSGAVVTSRNATNLLIESQGGKVDLNRDTSTKPGFYLPSFPGGNYRNDTNTLLEYLSQDDITSQTLQSTGGALQ